MATTWNPSDTNANVTLSGGDLIATAANTAWKSTRATRYRSSGKWYFEVTPNVSTNVYIIIGVGRSTATLNSYVGSDTSGMGYNNDGRKFYNSGATAYGASYTVGDVVGVALDLDGGTLVFYKNGASQGTAFSSISGSYAPMGSPYATGIQFTANFGATTFAYTPPSGHQAWGSDEYLLKQWHPTLNRR